MARNLLNCYPFHTSADVVSNHGLHIAIAGFGVLGQTILMQAIRLCHYDNSSLQLTIIDENISSKKADFLKSHPNLSDQFKINFMDIKDLKLCSEHLTSSVFVCIENDDVNAVRTNRLFIEKLRENINSAPVYLYLRDLKLSSDVENWDGQTFPFSSNIFAHDISLQQNVDALAINGN